MTNPISKIEAIHHLWRIGKIGLYYLYEHQKPLHDMLKNVVRDIIVLNISRRFGKTTTCLTYSFEEAIKNKQDIRYATAFLVDVEEFLLPIASHLMEGCPKDVRPVYKASRKEFHFPNGSRIKLVGLDKNPNGIRGNAIDILIIDEAAFVDKLEYLYKSIIVPATANRSFKIVFPSTPPLKVDHFWVQELIPKAKMRGTYMEFTLDDNTSLDDEEKQRLIDEVGGRESTTARREFFCEIIRDPELIVIPEYSEERHVKELKLPEYYYPLFTIDFGGSMDKHGMLITYWDFERAKFCVYRECLLPKNTSSKIIREHAKPMEEAVQWMKGEGPERIGDAPEQLRIDLLADDFYCAPPMKEKGSVEANINSLRLACLRDELEIDKSCEMLKLTLEYGSWLENREDWQRTEDLGHLDLLAALLYAYRHIDKKNPFPDYYGKSLDKVETPEREDTITDDEINLFEGF